ncbi:PQQ-dependent sugar dehydrogenase [Microbacterium sp. HJ5]
MTSALRFIASGCLVLAVTAVAACAPGASPRPVPPSAPPVATPPPATASEAASGWWRIDGAPQTLASGLSAPWSVVPTDDGGALISQRDDGAVLELDAGGEVRAVGTLPGVLSGGESGLHGLALRADGGTEWLYAYHGSTDDNRVVRMPLLGGPGARTLGEAEVVFDGIPRESTHNGGRLAFGPDGFLYVTTGDAQRREAAQDPDALGGKILRLTPEGDPAPGNPWGTAVWSLGHRNVQGVAWTSDGVMWASEFGQNAWDELNRIEPGGNYGWPVVEGDAGRAGMIDPVAVWATSESSPSGIAAHGDTIFVAALRGERMWVVDTAGGELRGEPLAALTGEQGRLRDVVAVTGDALWVLTNNTDGRGDARPEDDLLLRLTMTPAP